MTCQLTLSPKSRAIPKQQCAKNLLLVSLFSAVTLSSHAQGTLDFRNFTLEGIDAPVLNAAGNRIIGPGPYVADLFWSISTTTPTDNLVAYGFNHGFLTANANGGGYFLGGIATLPVTGTIQAQIRAWDTTFGSTYAQARDNGGGFGYSNPVLVPLQLPPNAPAEMIGLQGFQLQVIPEPSSLFLAVLGGAIFLLQFRKRIPPRSL